MITRRQHLITLPHLLAVWYGMIRDPSDLREMLFRGQPVKVRKLRPHVYVPVSLWEAAQKTA